MSLHTDSILDDVQHQVTLTPALRDSMKQTAKWTKFTGGLSLFLSVLVFIAAFLSLLGFFIEDGNNRLPLALMIMGLGFLGLVVYISWTLYQYGKQIKRVADGEELVAMGTFLQEQRTFWRSLGLFIGLLFFVYFLLIGYFTTGAPF